MLYYKEDSFELHNGYMQDVLDTFAENSIDSIVCDPPYELNFMGKGWDNSGVAFQKDAWEHCYRVLKPGGYLLAFGGSRTFHRIAVAIEDAGFEIRDTIMWLYGSGFPKSLNVGIAIDKKNGVESEVVGIGKSGNADTHTRCMNSVSKTGKEVFGGEFEIKQAQNEWKGWGTALKPAYEPIIVARKPFKSSLVDNILKYGVGGLNIDECRVATDEKIETGRNGRTTKPMFQSSELNESEREYQEKGRFPANVILTYDETDKNEVCGGMPDTRSNESVANYERSNNDNITHLYTNIKSGVHYEDEGSAARYFYCAKASKKDRDSGLIEFDQLTVNDGRKTEIDNPFQRGETLRKNTHPTVKPVELMQYLVRLVTKKGGVVLDCFMGSGSTGKAVMFENRERNANYYFIGVEMTEEYLPICKARIEYGKYKYEYDIKQEQAESMAEKGYMQPSIFDI